MLESYTSTHPQPRFWGALADGRFELPKCATCDEWQPPGAMACARCGSNRLVWQTASGTGVVYSLMERHSAIGGDATFVLVVELREGPFMMGVLAGPSARVKVGMGVRSVTPSPPSAEGLVRFTESEIHSPNLAPKEHP